MAKPAKYYNVEDFNDYKRKQGKCLPPQVNVLAAACHMQALFDAKRFTWGFMGGLAMLCLGYKREMPDLHIAYDDKDFNRIKAELSYDPRIRLPTGLNPLLPFKVIVWTGPEYRDQGCTVNASIELDLVPSGSCHTPAAGALGDNVVQLSLRSLSTSNGQQKVFKCLNIRFLLATMLFYCRARDLLWDPRKDILYLCKTQSVEVKRIRAQVNTKEVQELFLGTPFFSRLYVEDQRLCYRLLLNADPPPTMAITPPPPQVSVSSQATATNSMEHKLETQRPRSRYHNVSGQRKGSSTVDHRLSNDARPQSTNQPQDPRRLSHIPGVQSVTKSKPQPTSSAAAAKQARMSMPHLIPASRPTLTSYKSAQEITATTSHQHHHSTPYMVQAPSRPAQHNSSTVHENHASSQLGSGGGHQRSHKLAKGESEDIGQDFPVGGNTVTSRSDFTKMHSTGTSTHGIQSHEGGLHIVNSEEDEGFRRQLFQHQSMHPHDALHLVGPEGTFATLDHYHDMVPPQEQYQRHHSAPLPLKEPNFVFELDASMPPTPGFIAELPTKSIVSRPEPLSTTRSQNSHNSKIDARPLEIRTISAPLGLGHLPPSLVAGGPGLHAYRQSLIHTEAAKEPMDSFSSRTNAYRYSSFVFPKSAFSEDLYSSSDEGIASIYKAYRPYAVSYEHDSGFLSPRDDASHKRSVSDDSTASHDSRKLAKEYQDLLNFEDGYGSD